MPTAIEFQVTLEDRPGTLGKLARALGDRGVNILAFEAFGKSIHLVVDNPTTAETVLHTGGYSYTEAEVGQVTLPHRPGALARAASRLGEAGINIHYAYCGLAPGTNAPLAFFGVAELAKAVPLLEQAAAATAGA
ncbi:MAG TPA: ACT domain-containing protein [Candidatus Acidoferrales bacterium]|jgi:hypothetical protein|nr:ACT domain-containing protein [Candidatus Acidoferrales bacterium]